MITLEEIIEAAVIAIFIIVGVTMLLLVLKVQPNILKGRTGWLIISIATIFFGIRAFGHFVDDYWFQILRHSIGIVNSFLFPLGLYLICSKFRSEK